MSDTQGDLINLTIKDLSSADAEVRQAAVRTLGKIQAVAAVGEIIPLLRDSSWIVRMYAAEALGRIGSSDSEAVKGLMELLHDSRPNVVGQAIIALKVIGTTEALDAIIQHETQLGRNK